MKKISLFLTVCILVSCLCGCGRKEDRAPVVLPEVPRAEGEPQSVDTKGLKEYVLDCGLTFYGPSDLKETKIDGMAAYLRNTYFLVMVIEEPREGTVLQDATKEEYADMLSSGNGLKPFVTDRWGNLATTNTALAYDEDNTFFYYVTVLETDDSFCLIQIACPEELAQTNVEDMARWSATFTAAPPEA